MEKQIITFSASEQTLTKTGGIDHYASNTVSYVQAVFDLGENWAGFDSVRAVFKTPYKTKPAVLDHSGRCLVPFEVLKYKCKVFVNLVGSISEEGVLTDRLTSYPIEALTIDANASVDNSETAISPTEFEEFVAIVSDDADRAEAGATASEASADRAEASAESALASAQASEASAIRASNSASDASASAQTAQEEAQKITGMVVVVTQLPEGATPTSDWSDGVLTIGIPKGDTGETGATGNGIESAVLNADYTLTLTFTDGTSYTTPSIRGATGATGATGNGISSVTLTSTSGAVKTYTIAFTDGTNTTFDVTDGEVTQAVLDEEITALKSDFNRAICPNLMGSEVGKLYPVNIKAGSKFTVSTSDGSIFPTSGSLQVQLLDINGNQTDYFSLKNGETYRTITTSASRADTYYLRWNTAPDVPLMVNYGASPMNYVLYFDPTSRRFTQIEDSIEFTYRKTDNDAWQIGTLSGGEVVSNNKRIVDTAYIPVGIGTVISTSALQLSLAYYDSNKIHIVGTGWSKDDVVVANPNAKFIRVCLRVNDAHVFTEDEIYLYKDTVTIKYSGATIADALQESATSVNPETARNQSFNSAFHTGATDFETKCTQFSSLMYGDAVADITAPNDCESFLFFTDPHLLMWSGWENECYEFIAQIQKYYNSTPTTFCLCGGDWLGNDDLPSTACYKMGYVDGFMNSMFRNMYMLVGNHDTNYQGKKDADSARGSTRLSKQSIIDLWYREEGKAYFTFNGANTKFYAFDTGTEGQLLTSYGNYGYEQAEWFASALESDNSPHIALALHMIYHNTIGGTLQPLSELVLTIAEAYNNRSSVTVNGNSYNYANNTGKIEFTISGHTHSDGDFVLNGIRNIVTTNVVHSGYEATFDLVLVDYDSNKVILKRVGYGSDREIDL